MNIKDIIQKAKQKANELEKLKQDKRYQNVIGKFVASGFIIAEGIPSYPCKVSLEDVLWTGELEPRVLELLPAILIKKPSILKHIYKMPEDLEEVCFAIRRRTGTKLQPFRGVRPEDYMKWLPLIGLKGKTTQITKSFRFYDDDISKLQALAKKYKKSEVEIIRMSLQMLE